MSTDLEVRGSFDLTRAPDERWNAEMVDVVARNVFRGRDITKPQLHYCLAVAEGVGLNPLIGEIYFIPSKSRDAKGPAWVPYIGRNGLVKKANDRGYHYESDTVHENDRFRMTRKKDGTVEVTHSYTQADRGEILGAYAFLHDDTGRRKPAFFYADIKEYLPTFDADWKMEASPWGNTRSAMIEKCAKIGAGRKRLDMGNVLADGEIARFEQMQATTPRTALERAAEAPAAEFAWDELEAPADLVERLKDAVGEANDITEGLWPAAKLEMVTAGRSEGELVDLAQRIEAEVITARSQAVTAAAGTAEPPVPESTGEPDGAVTDAEVVPELTPEQHERVALLKTRAVALESRIAEVAPDSPESAGLGDELDAVQSEIAATENPDQTSMGL